MEIKQGWIEVKEEIGEGKDSYCPYRGIGVEPLWRPTVAGSHVTSTDYWERTKTVLSLGHHGLMVTVLSGHQGLRGGEP